MLARALAFLQDLVLPVDCAGCGRVGVPLCAACLPALADRAPAPRTVHGLPVTSALVYDEAVRRVLIAYKNEGRTELARPLAQALRAAVDAALPADRPVALVPMPRTRRSSAQRGYDPVRVLLRRARLPYRDVLRLAAAPADQVTLSREDRFANLAGRMRVVAPAGCASSRRPPPPCC